MLRWLVGLLVLTASCSSQPTCDASSGTCSASGGGTAGSGGGAAGGQGGQGGGAAGGQGGQGGQGGGSAGGQGGGAPVDGGTDGGSTDGGAVDAGPVPVALSEFCDLLSRAQCTRAQRCGHIEAARFDACVRARLVGCNDPTFAGAAYAGLVGFDGLQARRCLDEHPSFSCVVAFSELNEPCYSVFIPDAGVGDRCSQDLRSCREGLCRPDVSNVCAACQAFAQLGESCGGRVCQPDLRCVGDAGMQTCVARLGNGAPCTSGGQCVAGQCVTRLDGGTFCGGLTAGEPCETFGGAVCEPSSYCAGAAYRTDPAFGIAVVSTGVCTARTPDGGTCSFGQLDTSCPGNAPCLDGHCVRPANFSRDAGAECSNDRHCASGSCGDPIFLPDGGPRTTPGACLDGLAPGSPCRPGDRRCAAPATCRANSCALPIPLSGACSAANGGCMPTTSCIGSVCTANADLGQPCAGRLCESGLFCDQSVDGGACRAPRAGGGFCTNVTQCASGTCLTDAGTNGSVATPGQCTAPCY
ncbi:MAG: hypothetical protein K1X89_21825 [Myxococcaceae bacterium]|nr:hypothetical protein [Myxococcaceae bacterium]